MKKVNSISGDTLFARNESLLTAEVDGELMAMSIEQGNCYGLNMVGTRIWALLAEPRTVDAICDQLLSEYDVDAAQCREEVISLLEALRAEGLATIRDG